MVFPKLTSRTWTNHRGLGAAKIRCISRFRAIQQQASDPDLIPSERAWVQEKTGSRAKAPLREILILLFRSVRKRTDALLYSELSHSGA